MGRPFENSKQRFRLPSTRSYDPVMYFLRVAVVAMFCTLVETRHATIGEYGEKRLAEMEAAQTLQGQWMVHDREAYAMLRKLGGSSKTVDDAMELIAGAIRKALPSTDSLDDEDEIGPDWPVIDSDDSGECNDLVNAVEKLCSSCTFDALWGDDEDDVHGL